ncbi:hypothetical protein VRU48_11135 [Pedobacter sp. KR3-3]|uniref:Lipoprotein n=1 Tax=Pedobacter albus TaxID=3113905 RepID=A0ABU7I881_9SPHI|nr:hypothetical protein [Pedobacter sp. KR3-3]MEE1945661.1 hypothetical protein [Pedobacter sp. KR3-3]
MKYQYLNKTFFGLLLLLFALTGCKEKDFQSTRSQDQADLSRLRIELDKLSGQSNCDATTEWVILAIGAKSCGGPSEYIAYNKKIDVEQFLKKVAIYTNKQKAFNVKWGFGSDCSVIEPPKSVACVDGKAKLVY